ncbi:MAG: hypothetical protein FWH03_00380 [Firmicutes bacterium]|nr:hypothetical protein [Bacillota bacterium]
MIEFSGEYSEECKKHLLKTHAVLSFVVALILCVLFSIPVVIGIFMWNWLLVIALFVLISFTIFAAISPFIFKAKILEALTPKNISIDEEGLIAFEFEKHTVLKRADNIKKIIDKGEWYKIVLLFPKIDGFIIQKNLITAGTLEEFEKLFKNEITRP